MLNNIRIVLVETTHPGNIGATARAMKTMELQRLYLVSPKEFPHEAATARASGADDVLEKAKIMSSLSEAIEECALVIGTSARRRSLEWENLNPTECAQHVMQEIIKDQEVALVFGRERIGLTNEELAYCHYHVTIPASDKYASLNLASAVQIIAYEIYKEYLQYSASSERQVEVNYATALQMEQFYQHLEQVMVTTGFLNPEEPKKLMLRLKRLFSRARPDQREMNILRGILSAVMKKIPF